MNIKKCENGHFYNGDKYQTCPHCEERAQSGQTGPQEVGKPVYANLRPEPAPQVRGYRLDETMPETVAYRPASNTGDTVAYHPAANAGDAVAYHPTANTGDTVAYHPASGVSMPSVVKQPDNTLPVGWLVAVSGLEYGKQYPLFTCDNHIGSGENNTICLQGDAYVLPEHHCTLSFDLLQQKLVLNMQCSMGEVYVNDMPAGESRYLQHADCIRIGGSVYRFVELCRDGFSWWKPIQEPEDERPEEKTRIDDIDTAFAEEYKVLARTDLSGIRAGMKQRVAQEQNKNRQGRQLSFSRQEKPVYSEIGARDAAPGVSGETSVLAAPDEEEGETSILATATWRCRMCNGLNSEFSSICKLCGAKRG